MGTSIGQIPATLIAARRRPPAPEPGAARAERPSFHLTRPNAESAGNALGRANSGSPRAGFEPGTVSGPAAALVALGRSVDGARDAIPTLEEIRVRFQAGRALQVDRPEAASPGLRTNQPEGAAGSAVPASDRLAFERFNEARAFSTLETESVQPASARPPEGPEFASAEQPEEAPAPESEPAAPGAVPDHVQRSRLNLTA